MKKAEHGTIVTRIRLFRAQGDDEIHPKVFRYYRILLDMWYIFAPTELNVYSNRDMAQTDEGLDDKEDARKHI